MTIVDSDDVISLAALESLIGCLSGLYIWLLSSKALRVEVVKVG